MAERARLLAVVAVLAFLHFVMRPVFNEWFASPNLLLCALLLAARQLRPGYGAGLGFVLGILEDALAVTYFGLSAALMTILGYVGSRTRDLFLGEESFFMAAYLFAGTWLYEGIVHAAQGAEGLVGDLLLRGPLAALLTVMVGYVVAPLVRAR